MTKILIVEDEVGLRDDIMTWLSFEGYEVVGAADGVEGVNAAIQHQPDLIVCDISMPRLDGYGVMLDVRANSFTQFTPFIFLTARASLQDIRVGMDLGADDYLTKPFERLDLLHAIETRLERKSALREEQQQEISLFKEMLSHERGQRVLQANLAAMFSHDFRTPLTVIAASNNLLRQLSERSQTKTAFAPHMDRIESSVRQMMQMLEDMMLVVQMETGKFTYNPESLNVEEFFRQIIAESTVAYGSTHRILLENCFSGTMMVDSRLMRQMMTNLISNAVKYSPLKTEVRVTVDQHDNQCIIRVRDQGIGIPEADRDQLFEAFYRGSNAGNISGTGLGLTIVKRAVEETGGIIQVESHAGAGTTFTIAIPFLKP